MMTRPLTLPLIADNTLALWYRAAPPQLHTLYEDLSLLGTTALAGGFVRDAALHGTAKMPRDADMTCQTDDLAMLENLCKPWFQGYNKFGGLKLKFPCGFPADIWALKETWAFRTGQLEMTGSIRDVVRAVFASSDAIAVVLETKEVLDGGFIRTIQTGEIDIVLKANPSPHLCVVRLLVTMKQYGLRLAPAAFAFICDQVKGGLVWKQLEDWQQRHYGEQRITQADWDVLLPSIRKATAT